MSVFRIAIVREDGRRVVLRPGAAGERDFVDAIVTKAVAEGVGLLRTEARVRRAIAQAVTDTFRELKADVEPTHE